MSAVGVLVTVGANAALLGGGAAIASWGTGGFGEDDAQAAARASRAQDRQLGKAQGAVEGGVDDVNALLAPYQQAGTDSLAQQRALAGLDGPEAQQQAISALENSPQFQAMVAQGEDAILQNASATGGLRGGNTQAALAQFRPMMLDQLINQTYERLGGLTQGGQNAAGMGANAAMQGAGMVADLYGQRGSARAGGILGAQQARTNGRNQAINMGMTAAGGLAQMAMGMPPTALAGGMQQAPQQQAYNPYAYSQYDSPVGRF